MGMLYPTAGEIWYERQLLLHYETSSFIQLRTINGIVYQTFQEAAVACGLVTDKMRLLRVLWTFSIYLHLREKVIVLSSYTTSNFHKI